MAMRSVEREMLRLVAYHHPIDAVKLRRLLAERCIEACDFDVFLRARKNLTELGLISHPKMDINYYLTEDGWRQLGAETPLNDGDTLSQSTVLY
jgi:hypothetical protein